MKRCMLFLNLALLLVLLAGCKGVSAPTPAETAPVMNPKVFRPAVIADFPQISGRNLDVPDDYQAVAEDETLRLYIREASSAIIVEDKRNGVLWRSSPADLAKNKGTTTAWRKLIEVPVQVTYTDADRSQSKAAKVDKLSLAYQPVKNGVMVTYTFADIKLEFSIIYSLRNDSLEAMILDDTIKEEDTNYLVNIDLLSFFGATHDGDPGYIVYPDGSGALMHFDTPHAEEVQKISNSIYGTDTAETETQTGIYSEPIVMPVFGLSRGDSGFVGIITNGDYDCSLTIARSGKGVNYNHVWTQFLYRRQGRFSLSGGQPAWLFQPDRIPGDRQVRYQLLLKDQATYSGMATAFRDFLIQERGAKRLPANAPLMNLSFFMGIERRTWFLADMISMTTFSQTESILEDLDKEDVNRLDVSLWDWNKGGTAYKYPERLPVDERVGGEEGLKSLASSIKARDQRLFLIDDYLSVAPNSISVQPYLDTVRGVDGLPIGSNETGYMLNPQVALRKFAARDIPKMAGFDINGLLFMNFSGFAVSDKNTQYPLTRENFAASWMQIADLSRQTFGSVAMEGSNTYTVPYADRLDWVTMDSTHYDLFDETVPFYHIAVHGLVQYSGQPYNLLSEGKTMLLRQVEYGAIPYFVLSEESSAKLLRTNASSLYSSQYSFWRPEVVRQYKMMEPLAPLVNQFITGHEKLDTNVFQTTYEDGTRVIVNYNSSPYNAGPVSVPAQDFLVVNGG
jgi:hypothetical protein